MELAKSAVIIGNKAPEFRQVLQPARQDQASIDLLRISKDIDQVDMKAFVGGSSGSLRSLYTGCSA